VKFLVPVTALAMFGLLGAASPSPDTADPSMASAVIVKLVAQNGSGENGTATLTASGMDTIVKVSFPDSKAPPQPAHVHLGTCATLDPTPKYPLTNVVGGASVTTLKGVSLVSLQAGGYAINIHMSTSDLKTYVACGNIPKGGSTTAP
jgi:hypothetical protein